MKKYILLIVSSMMLVSCLDTIILPDDKTVDEDFWKNKSQVSSMVNAAYAALASNDVVARMIVWGDFRSDELLGPSGQVDVSDTQIALKEISSVNMQTTNMFGQWASFYNVINRCNMVLERAEAVMEEDPNYTIGDYQTDRSQMLALRALCYFYLVRNFRDVPYITEAYMNSSQNMELTQTAPEEVLQHCIDDLQEAVKNPINSRGYGLNEWQRVGWMTGDAIKTLLADIYLWRASVKHNAADYQQCVAYCDEVIASKKAQHVRGRNEMVEKEYPLSDAADMYTDLFVSMNAEESIFELQITANLPVCQYYYKYKSANADGGEGWLRAAPIFGGTASTYNNITTSIGSSTLFAATDLRYYAACYLPSTGEEAYSVRKMISQNPVTTKVATKKRETYGFGALNRNFNIYRLTDVMLMKAEAKIQLCTSTAGMSAADSTRQDSVNNALLEEAFNLVAAVNTRALYKEDQSSSSMTWTTFKKMTTQQFEQLVMQERMREFCFEGRRWYDLLRYNYRHINGVDYSKIMADQVGSLVPNSKDMLELMTRSRGTEASGVQAKMVNEAYLYMPVPNSDIIVCPQLRQNPAYKDTNEYEKTY